MPMGKWRVLVEFGKGQPRAKDPRMQVRDKRHAGLDHDPYPYPFSPHTDPNLFVVVAESKFPSPFLQASLRNQ